MASIFSKILAGEIDSEILYQNESVFVIRDINPVDTTHLLIIPKEEIVSINDLDKKNSTIIAEMTLVAQHIAKKMGVSEGYKLLLNVGDYQEVPHIHMHLISSRG